MTENKEPSTVVGLSHSNIVRWAPHFKLERGQDLVPHVTIGSLKDDDGFFSVKANVVSATSDVIYNVEIEMTADLDEDTSGGDYQCTCPDFAKQRRKRTRLSQPCKHQIATLLKIVDGDSRPLATVVNEMPSAEVKNHLLRALRRSEVCQILDEYFRA